MTLHTRAICEPYASRSRGIPSPTNGFPARSLLEAHSQCIGAISSPYPPLTYIPSPGSHGRQLAPPMEFKIALRTQASCCAADPVSQPRCVGPETVSGRCYEPVPAKFPSQSKLVVEITCLFPATPHHLLPQLSHTNPGLQPGQLQILSLTFGDRKT